MTLKMIPFCTTDNKNNRFHILESLPTPTSHNDRQYDTFNIFGHLLDLWLEWSMVTKGLEWQHSNQS